MREHLRIGGGQRGQILVLMALLFVILIGSAALAIDYGYGALQRTRLQSAADGAVLAAVYHLHLGATEAAASAAGTQVVNHDFFGPDQTTVTFAYLDGSRVPTANAAGVVYVDATTKLTHVAAFAGVIGIASFPVQAFAEAALGAACGICLLRPGGTDFSSTNPAASVTVTGATMYVNSGASDAINTAGPLSVPAGITVANCPTGQTCTAGPGSVQPTPTSGPTLTDPLAGLAGPAPGSVPAARCPSPQANVSCSTDAAKGTDLKVNGAATVIASPGRYHEIVVTHSGGIVVLQPGIYVFDVGSAGITLSSGGMVCMNSACTADLASPGVLLYFTCDSWYATPGAYCGGPSATSCASGAGGARLSQTGDSAIEVNASSVGAYQGIVIMYDPYNTAAFTLTGGAIAGPSASGTIYAACSSITLTGPGSSGNKLSLNSNIIASAISITGSGGITDNVTPGVNRSTFGAKFGLIQ